MRSSTSATRESGIAYTIDRYSWHLPIEPDYIGIPVDTITEEKVKVQWKETDGRMGFVGAGQTVNSE